MFLRLRMKLNRLIELSAKHPNELNNKYELGAMKKLTIHVR